MAGGVVLSVAALLAVAACDGGSTSNSLAAHQPNDSYAGGDAGTGVAPGGSNAPGAFPASEAGRGSAGDGLQDISAASLTRAQIKTASIGLHSSKVGDVVTSVESVAASQGGFVDSENTQTDSHGVATSSFLTLKVPVDNFDATVAAVATLGSLSSKKITTEDVTGKVADVASRVSSARDSIAQLRLLFGHATKLSDIITLESELSSRESDLEALEAQQRALTEQTTLSTVSVQVSRTATVAPPVKHTDHATGFFGGLKQGWNALSTSFVAVSHGLGAALPLGLTLALIALVGWVVVRRLPMPRRRPDTSG